MKEMISAKELIIKGFEQRQSMALLSEKIVASSSSSMIAFRKRVKRWGEKRLDGETDLRYWMYYCADFDFGTHLVCARSDQREEMNQQRTDDHEGVEQSDCQLGTEDGLNPVRQVMNEMRETQLAMMKMQNQLNTAQMMAQIMTAFRFRP
ncbi:hypothetical protein F0562_018661 [Nyssa sinensis]|uniref:Uncharacterized protein n=1 Tax=Nyssa sinensis TaxID=561372 RepID=A0A5J4ZE15_9ASTE|nr:hypothetical protein F0562_018661 [Nyssa sinensis]